VVSGAKLKESDLSDPVKNLFENLGYSVKSEVNNCDLMAVKEDEICIIELKLGFTIDLLLQSVKRQKISDLVYLAIPRPKKNYFSSRWRDIKYLTRRLELGLIFVSFRKGMGLAEIIVYPEKFDRKHSENLNKRHRKKLESEFSKRSSDFNRGGVSRTKIITGYREDSIKIAFFIKNRPDGCSITLLLETGLDRKRITSILQKNFYGWFERVNRGIYCLTEKGKKELGSYSGVIALFK